MSLIWTDPFDIFFANHNELGAPINVGHNEKEILLQVSLPGFSRSDIDVEVNSGRLAITTKRHVEKKEDYTFTTRQVGLSDYSRSWTLPEGANSDAIEANYEAGILSVRIPYSHNRRETVRKIELR